MITRKTVATALAGLMIAALPMSAMAEGVDLVQVEPIGAVQLAADAGQELEAATEGWTWFDRDGGEMSAEDVASMTDADKALAVIEGRYAVRKADSAPEAAPPVQGEPPPEGAPEQPDMQMPNRPEGQMPEGGQTPQQMPSEGGGAVRPAHPQRGQRPMQPHGSRGRQRAMPQSGGEAPTQNAPQ